MTERETTGAETGLPGPGPRPGRGRGALARWLALIAGSTTTLVAASLLGSALGFLNKAACRGGDWNIYLKQFQAHCYTDIYPLYYNEKPVRGPGPLRRAPGRVPGADRRRDAGGRLAGPAHRRPVRPRPGVLRRHRRPAGAVRGGGHACHGLPGRASRRWTALLVALAAGPDPRILHQLGPDRDGAGRGGHGGLGRAPAGPGRRAAGPGGGDQVLPAGLLRPAAAAVPARGRLRAFAVDRGRPPPWPGSR